MTGQRGDPQSASAVVSAIVSHWLAPVLPPAPWSDTAPPRSEERGPVQTDNSDPGGEPPTAVVPTPSPPPAPVETRAAEIEVKAWASCPVFNDFWQLKALTSVRNEGEGPLPIAAGLDSSLRLLVRTPGGDGFSAAPQTPAALEYEVLEFEGGAVVAVPPNPPNTTVPGVGDFATRYWPPSREVAGVSGYLAPGEVHYVAPIEERGGLVTRGSSLVFNLPVDEALQLMGLALVVDGSVVTLDYFDDWPAENENANF